ncbi:DUF3649 domain-containing protein [Pigmentiphaga aceris]|uniref:DUF3649 domain-containing protein n=1 Tax=Pigmentiphaga aceris TaxID=1940612 RepID=A0A5C0B2Z0_9BURK|nr:DUF3649 domain-containing protein [Pigmentiphaga aceris]QEI07121.1 DUF3649 domain-containing protein [Pigmentiphaga aceris]
MSLSSSLIARAPLVSRIIAAIFGGYGLASLAAVALTALPGHPSEAVLIGMMLSFVVYTCAVIWVFAARSAWRAWAGLLITAAPLALIVWTLVTPVKP